MVLAILAVPVGFFLWLANRTENSRDEIVQAESCLQDLAAQVTGRVQPLKLTGVRRILGPGQQALFDRCVEGLKYRNKQIAVSRFVARTGVYVEQYGLYGPDSFGYAQDSSSTPWAEKEWSASLREASGVGLVSGAGTFAFVLLGLLSLRWSWRFLLDRIRELSSAVRGK
jgi:hypothetical protein